MNATKNFTKRELKTTTKTKNQAATLTALQEKVVRMTQGFSAPLNLELGQLSDEAPHLGGVLHDLEKRAWMSAKNALKNNPTKRKIIEALKKQK